MCATKVTLSNSQPTNTENMEELCQLANDVPNQEDVPYSTVDKGTVSEDSVGENVDAGPTSSLVQHLQVCRAIPYRLSKL